MSSPVLVWFRQDLRLSDHPALTAALDAGEVVPVFIFDPAEPWAPGAASRWWLHFSLQRLAADLQALGSRLILRQGETAAELTALLAETGAVRIFASRLYEPALAERDHRLQQRLPLELFSGAYLSDPGAVRTGSGTPYKVFTPYWRACLAQLRFGLPLPAPAALPPVPALDSLPLEALALLPQIPWDGGLRQTWQAGEAAAQTKLAAWVAAGLRDYDTSRNFPGRPGSSRLSPHLHFGEISPRQVWHAVQAAAPDLPAEACRVYLSEIGWREFACQILHFFPHTDTQPMDERFGGFPWQDDPAALRAWQKGRTGYPIVDAGMRELWATGWMHNRVRMIVASFLTKDLILPWLEGARWFWDTLVDADLAANSLNWQWAAGCGADAAPYFRIFNPVSQGQKFDPEGRYVRQWVPELAGLPDKWLHRPWEAPEQVLAGAGVTIGGDYPRPIVAHDRARQAALAAFGTIKK